MYYVSVCRWTDLGSPTVPGEYQAEPGMKVIVGQWAIDEAQARQGHLLVKIKEDRQKPGTWTIMRFTAPNGYLLPPLDTTISIPSQKKERQ